ncbi:transposase family protein [Curtobacterium ammoniigenes]|uniref:transposase family protein n=1 Tax=Curtobacterium ammoniigenes TaxID=395387 RepID=UPI0012EE1253
MTGRGLQDGERPSILKQEDPDVAHRICGRGACYCALADVLLNADGLHLISVAVDSKAGYLLGIETDPGPRGCPGCGVVARLHARRQVRISDAPILGLPVVLHWSKRVFRCLEPACPVTTHGDRHAGRRGPGQPSKRGRIQ